MARLEKVLFMLAAVVLWAGSAQAAFTPGEYNTDAHTVALYHLNQSSGTAVTDSSGNGHDGTLVNSPLPTWTAGDFGNGLHIAGYPENGGFNTGVALPGGNAGYTLEFYYKWDYAYIDPVGRLWGAAEADFACAYLVDHGASPATYRIDFGVRRGDGSYAEILTPADNTLTDSWHHIAFTRSYDGTNTNYAVYVDAVQKASGSFVGGWWDPGNGVHFGNTGYNASGTFDEIRISSGVRTDFGVPEPATMGLLLIGGLAALRKRV